MQRKLILTMGTVCLLVASPTLSWAGLTISDWKATPSQTVGDATWTLTSTTLPGALAVNLISFNDLRIQDNAAGVLAGGSFTLNYTVTLNDGLVFNTVSLDSTYLSGSTTVTKTVDGAVTLTSVNGNPSGAKPIPGMPATLTVTETIDVSAGAISDFSNVYTVVPEPGTLVAGGLLLLPFGVSTLRILRKDQKA
jgi:hypothetical protein